MFITPLSHAIERPFGIDACWLVENDRPVVRFVLTNQGSSQLEIPYTELPWNQNIIMILYRGNPGVGFELQQKHRPLSFPPGSVIVSRGESISNEMMLDRHFVDVGSLEDISELTFLWSYSTPKRISKRYDFNGVLYLYKNSDHCLD